MLKQPYYLHFLIILSTLFLFFHATPIYAVITASGNVNPADPSTWTSSTTAYIGQTTNGTVMADSGSNILSRDGYIAYSSGCTGTVTVDGDGSTWTNGSNIKVGYNGNAKLNITGGGAVSDSSGFIGGYVGSSSSSISVATVTGAARSGPIIPNYTSAIPAEEL